MTQVKNLQGALENIKMLQSALQEKRKMLDKELDLAGKIKHQLCDVLYAMTGETFYKEMINEDKKGGAKS